MRTKSHFPRGELNLFPFPCDYQDMEGAKPTRRVTAARGTDNAGQLLDEFLVTLVLAGDRKAQAHLAKRWHPRLLRTARRLLLDDELAASAVQDAWISILRGIGSLRDPSRFAPWAFGILRRRCADTIRKAGRGRSVFASDADAEASAPADQGEALAIRQAFAALPPDQRLAAQLYFAEGLTLAEIAEAQGVPLGTAKSRLFHARRQLKAALTGDET